MDHSLEALRRDYQQGKLSELNAGVDPVSLFNRWLKEAQQAGQLEPNAMTLATVDAIGNPHARIVLLKGQKDRQFIFYTNYQSQKGQDLLASPKAALCFWWDTLERQVRIEGSVEKLIDAENDAYFASRPRNSRIGAWASQQSEEIASHAVLEEAFEQLDLEYPNEVPRPAYWGGYRVMASRIEFWQGRSSRLHDRIDFHFSMGNWTRVRRSP